MDPAMDILSFDAAATLPKVLREKYGDLNRGGWGPRIRSRFGYATPDDWYEAFISSMVTSRTVWLDVGCGRNIFPHNPVTEARLSKSCQFLVGLDPDDNIDDNQAIHERVKCDIESYNSDRRYDLVTLRMVAEHITAPEKAVAKLTNLVAPGGRIVVYTVSKWTPSALLASITPEYFHHVVKRLLWNAQERDTFPTAYLLNTRGSLRTLFQKQGFSEEKFVLLNDCRSTSRVFVLQIVELSLQKLLNLVGIRYPEVCILAIYKAPA